MQHSYGARLRAYDYGHVEYEYEYTTPEYEYVKPEYEYEYRARVLKYEHEYRNLYSSTDSSTTSLVHGM